jgi:hypothetical protein
VEESKIVFRPGDKVRLIHDVAIPFYDRNEIYITGTKGSIATVITSEEYFIWLGHGYSAYILSNIASQIKEGMKYPVRYEQMMPLSLIDDPLGSDIIYHGREGDIGLIGVNALERVE